MFGFWSHDTGREGPVLAPWGLTPWAAASRRSGGARLLCKNNTSAMCMFLCIYVVSEWIICVVMLRNLFKVL